VASEERAPLSPACGKPMKLARVTGRPYGRNRLRTYECDSCKVSYTEGEAADEEGT
jgi:hypothetical protein